jgi:poly(A) polymerase
MNALLDHPLLVVLATLSHKFPGTGGLHLVGGAIRDALLHRPVADFDFTSPYDPTPLAQALAPQLGGHWFWLDEPRRQSRVMAGGVTCDFAPFRAPTLAADLAARDFTINAMAFDLAGPLTHAALIDPLDGCGDLAARTLRCAGAGVLHDDPLRILKGIRHAAELDLAIEPATLGAMQAAAVRLPVMAPERLRLEMWRIMATPASQGLDGLVASGAGEVLFGPNLRAAVPGIRRRLLGAQALFAELSATTPMVAEWLKEPVEQGLDRAALLHWHCLLDAVEQGLPLTLARRWRFSRLALGRLTGLGRIVPELWQELQNLPSAPRPVALWARQFAPDPVDLLLTIGLLREDQPMAIQESLAPRLRLLAELPDPRQVPPLIAGNWLETELGVTGKAIGAVQAELIAAEIHGDVSDADEARRYLLARHPENG